MKGNLIAELQEKFAVLPTADLGDCIVIPGEELDLDWILSFFELGYRFEGAFIDGRPVLLVQLKLQGLGWKGRRPLLEAPA